jgi:outer membrane lipoprotein-sorting protein
LRLNLRMAACTVWMLGLAAAFGTPARAQELLPEQSAEKARQVLQQVISALGGQAFLDVHDTQCEGRIAQFGSNEELMGFTPFRDLWLLPDKNRTEYISKGEHTIAGFLMGIDGLMITHGGVMITVFNGDEGWMLDKAGVSNQPEDVIKNFTDVLKTGMNNVLRTRRNEPGVEARYGGTDLIDLKEAEWIEFTDRDRHDMRLAVDKSTHLPLRWVVAKRDPETRVRTEVSTSYTQYISVDGVKTPLSIVRTRDGRRITQTFLTGCKYNSNLEAQLFTRASLDQRAGDVVKKGYKNAKDKN